MRCCGKGFQIPGQIGLQRLHCTIFRQQSIVCCREYSKIKQYSQIKCTRSYDSVGTLYANRHFNPINRTRSRPSHGTLYAGCFFLPLPRDLVHRVHLLAPPAGPCTPGASSWRMESDRHNVIFFICQAGQHSCSATYVYTPFPCRTLWPIEELLF